MLYQSLRLLKNSSIETIAPAGVTSHFLSVEHSLRLGSVLSRLGWEIGFPVQIRGDLKIGSEVVASHRLGVQYDCFEGLQDSWLENMLDYSEIYRSTFGGIKRAAYQTDRLTYKLVQEE